MIGPINRVFYRYCFKGLLFPFAIANIAFILVGLIDVIFTLLDYLVNRGISVGIVFQLLVYKIPALVVLFLPVATLFSVMFVIFQWIKDNEIVVFWTAGIRYEKVFAPVVIFAILITALSFYLGEYVVPSTNFKSNTLIHRVILKESIPSIEENVFFKDVGDKVFYINKIDKERKEMQKIMLYETNQQYPRVITAERATWNGNHWTLIDGKIYKYSADGFLDYEAFFKNLKIKVNYDINMTYQKIKNTMEMSSKELKERIVTIEKAGINSKRLKIDYYLKFAGPFSNLIFSLIGIVLIFVFVRSGRDAWGIIISIILSLCCVMLFFFLTGFVRALGIGGAINPMFGAWIPNVIFFFFVSFLWMFYRVRH